MPEHWFIVASQKTVKIFTEVSNLKRLEQFKEFDNPLGRERNAVLVKKQAGRGVRSVGRGVVHYPEKKPQDPHDVAAIQFAKKIAEFLESECQRKKFKSLTVVAEPRFMGKLRGEMNSNLKNHVTEWITKDLLKTPKKKLLQFLLPVNYLSERPS